MQPHTTFSFCNQSRRGAGHVRYLGARDVESSAINWIRVGTAHWDIGIIGIVADEHGIYATIQPRKEHIRVIHFDRHSFRILSEYNLQFTRDPHFLCIHDGDLLIASSGNNSIFHLGRIGGKMVSEELFWHFPDTSDDQNDIHLYSGASHGGQVFAPPVQSFFEIAS